MFYSEQEFKTLFGLVSIWNQLPSLLIEIAAIITVSMFNIGWSICVCLAIAAPMSFFRFGLINNLFMFPAMVYVNWLKWPVRIGALFCLPMHRSSDVIYLLCIFLFGARLMMLPWNNLFEKLMQVAIDGQLLNYRAAQLIAEKCLGQSILNPPLMALPLKLPSGQTYDRAAEALMDAAKIKDSDPALYASIMSETSKIFGRRDAEGWIRTFQNIDAEKQQQSLETSALAVTLRIVEDSNAPDCMELTEASDNNDQLVGLSMLIWNEISTFSSNHGKEVLDEALANDRAFCDELANLEDEDEAHALMQQFVAVKALTPYLGLLKLSVDQIRDAIPLFSDTSLFKASCGVIALEAVENGVKIVGLIRENTLLSSLQP